MKPTPYFPMRVCRPSASPDAQNAGPARIRLGTLIRNRKVPSICGPIVSHRVGGYAVLVDGKRLLVRFADAAIGREPTRAAIDARRIGTTEYHAAKRKAEHDDDVKRRARMIGLSPEQVARELAAMEAGR